MPRHNVDCVLLELAFSLKVKKEVGRNKNMLPNAKRSVAMLWQLNLYLNIVT